MGTVPESGLVEHISATSGLSPAEAARVIDDVLAYYTESTPDFVRRRHAQLRASGAKNDEIFSRLRTELHHRLVAAPHLSERQLRRIIYG